MSFYEELYKTIPRRIIMRALEIGLVSAAIGILAFGIEMGWFPPLWMGVAAATLKALRELRDSLKE